MKLAAWLNSGNRAAFMIAAVFGTAYFGFFFDDNIFYFVFAAFYGVYAMMRAQFAPDAASTLFYRIFLGFAVILFISNAGRIMDTSISEFSGRDWRITFHPLVVLMILDASYFVVKHFKLNVPALSPYLIAAIIAGTLSFVFLGQDRTLGQILTITSERTSGIIERNFNLADDVYFFLTCSLVSLLLYLKTSRPVFWLTVLVSAALSLYFMLMVVGGQSRAAWLGVLAGVGAATLYGVLHRRYLVPFLLVLITFMVGIWQYDNIEARVLKEAGIYQELWAQWQASGTIDLEKLDQDKGLSTYLRLQGYENARVLLKDSPWVGHGGFNTEKLKEKVPYGDNLVFIAHTHNIFIDVAIRQGIGVGLVYVILMIFPIVLSAWMCGKAANGDPAHYYFATILLAYAIYVLVENMVDLSYIRSDPGVRIQYLYFGLSGLLLAQLTSSSPTPVQADPEHTVDQS